RSPELTFTHSRCRGDASTACFAHGWPATGAAGAAAVCVCGGGGEGCACSCAHAAKEIDIIAIVSSAFLMALLRGSIMAHMKSAAEWQSLRVAEAVPSTPLR